MQTTGDTIALPGFELDLAQALLRDGTGAEVRLRPQAMAVLQFLARNAGRVVTKDELMQSVWAGTVVTDDSLVQCVKMNRFWTLRNPGAQCS
jgi:DNA-binding winged helix-turn-helix (wHTH) protein